MPDEKVRIQEFWKGQKNSFIALGMFIALIGSYRIFWSRRILLGLETMVMALLIPLGLYRGYFIGVALMIFGVLLTSLYPSPGILLFIIGILYILTKESKKENLQ